MVLWRHAPPTPCCRPCGSLQRRSPHRYDADRNYTLRPARAALRDRCSSTVQRLVVLGVVAALLAKFVTLDPCLALHYEHMPSGHPMPWAGPSDTMEGMGQMTPPSRSLGNRRSQRNALTPVSTAGNDSEIGQDELDAAMLELEHVIGPVIPSGGRSGSSDGIQEDQERMTGQKSKRTSMSTAAQGVFPPAPHAGEMADEAYEADNEDDRALLPGDALVAAAQPVRDALALAPEAQAEEEEDVEVIMDDQADDHDDIEDEQFAALAAACAMEADVRLNRATAAAQQDAEVVPALEAALPVGEVVRHDVGDKADETLATFHTAIDVHDIQQERIQMLQDELKRLQSQQLVASSPFQVDNTPRDRGHDDGQEAGHVGARPEVADTVVHVQEHESVRSPNEAIPQPNESVRSPNETISPPNERV